MAPRAPGAPGAPGREPSSRTLSSKNWKQTSPTKELLIWFPIGSMYAIYGNIYHQHTAVMLAYIPAPWIRHGFGYTNYHCIAWQDGCEDVDRHDGSDMIHKDIEALSKCHGTLIDKSELRGNHKTIWFNLCTIYIYKWLRTVHVQKCM